VSVFLITKVKMAMDPKAQGAALLEKLKRYEAAADPGQRLPDRNNEGRANQGGSEAASFPARYLQPDDRDDYMQIKGELAGPGRPAPVTDEDVSAVLRKRAAFEVAKQEDWFQNSWKFNSSDPNKQRWAQSVFPEYFARREQVIDEQTLLQNQLAKIKLRGPRSREDLDLLYAIDMGLVNPDERAIWNIQGDTMANPRRRGVFSPRRVLIGGFNSRIASITNPLETFPRQANNERVVGLRQPFDMNHDRRYAGYQQ
jgi:hypothetical protein